MKPSLTFHNSTSLKDICSVSFKRLYINSIRLRRKNFFASISL